MPSQISFLTRHIYFLNPLQEFWENVKIHPFIVRIM